MSPVTPPSCRVAHAPTAQAVAAASAASASPGSPVRATAAAAAISRPAHGPNRLLRLANGVPSPSRRAYGNACITSSIAARDRQGNRIRMPVRLPSGSAVNAASLTSSRQTTPTTANAPTWGSRRISRRRSRSKPPSSASQVSMKPSRWRARVRAASAATSRALARSTGRCSARSARSKRAIMPPSSRPTAGNQAWARASAPAASGGETGRMVRKPIAARQEVRRRGGFMVNPRRRPPRRWPSPSGTRPRR